MKKQLLLWFLLIGYGLYGQDLVYTVQNNNLHCEINSRGLEIGLSNGSFLIYDEDGEEKSLMSAANLWLAGIKESGEVFISAPTYGGPTGAPSGILPKVFQIDRIVIDQHIADWEDNGVIDNPHPDIFGWPGWGNPFFEEYNDGMEFPGNSSNSAPFWDVNGDGIYNPNEGDFPILSVRGCDGDQAILPTQMNWCIYEILDSNTNEPIFNIKFNMFFFQCEEENPLNNTLFVQHILINQSAEDFSQFYGGLWADMDLGNFEDDHVGTMPERFVGYVYNADNEDEDNTFAAGFGENPPVFGMDILRTPFGEGFNEVGVGGIIPFYNGSVGTPNPGTTDPNTIPEFLNYLNGNWRDGSPLTFGGSGYQSGDSTDFAFPDLPDQSDGWSAFQEGLPGGDPRILMNFGEFDYVPGAVNEVISAFTFYNDDTDHVSKVPKFRDQIDQVQAFFDNCFDPESFGIGPCNQVLTDVTSPNILNEEVNVFPNPSSDQVNVQSNYNITQIHVLDATGRRLLSSIEDHFSVAQLPNGIYFLQIEIEDQVLFKRMIVE